MLLHYRDGISGKTVAAPFVKCMAGGASLFHAAINCLYVSLASSHLGPTYSIEDER